MTIKTRLMLSVAIAILGMATAHAEILELEGTVKAVDASARSITIERKTPKGTKTLELEVAKNAGDISGFKEGDAVSFAYNPDVDIISKIEKGMSEAAAADLKAFQGEWKNTLTEEKGVRLPPAEQRRENRTLIITGDTFRMERVRNGSFGAHEGKFKLDPERHFFDMEEPGGLTYVGIYELKGDTLKLCYRLYKKGSAPNPRPTEFKRSGEEPAVFNYEYKKVPQ